jgi:2-methylcitrate dehydratase PrpD
MDGNRRVAAFIHDIRWDDLPGPVREKAKLALLDVLGAALSGTQTAAFRIAAGYAETAWPGDTSAILLSGQKANPAGAAFANATAANGFDSDDGAKYTRGHPGAQLFPAALALCEKLGRGGEDLLTAMVVGYEVAMRTGRCWHDHHDIYQACGSWGSVATAAAAAHLLALDVPAIEHALGIAEYNAPNLPMMRDIDNPRMVKHGIGWGAMTGIISAELAQCGFTGIPSLLGFDEYTDWVADIGEHFLIVEGITFKEFASCGWGHSPINAVREVMEEHDIDPDEIAHVRVEGFHETVRLGVDLPSTTEEAQFSTGWPLAAYLLYGEVSPRQTNGDRLGDERLRTLLEKIELVENEQFSEWAALKWVGDPEGRYASQVTITLKDGTQHDSGVFSFSHDYGLGWGLDRVADKFRWLVKDVLPDGQIDSLIEMSQGFDEVENVTELTSLVG